MIFTLNFTLKKESTVIFSIVVLNDLRVFLPRFSADRDECIRIGVIRRSRQWSQHRRIHRVVIWRRGRCQTLLLCGELIEHKREGVGGCRIRLKFGFQTLKVISQTASWIRWLHAGVCGCRCGEDLSCLGPTVLGCQVTGSIPLHVSRKESLRPSYWGIEMWYINRKSYMRSPMAPLDLTLALKGQIQGHWNFECLYRVKGPSYAIC